MRAARADPNAQLGLQNVGFRWEEARLVRSCRDLIGVNEPRARLMLDAHQVLLRFAERHQLLSEPDIARSRQNLDRLAQQLNERNGG